MAMRKMFAKLSTSAESVSIKKMKEKLGKLASQEGAADKQPTIDVKPNVQTPSATSPSLVDILRKSIINAGVNTGMFTLGCFTAYMIHKKTK